MKERLLTCAWILCKLELLYLLGVLACSSRFSKWAYTYCSTCSTCSACFPCSARPAHSRTLLFPLAVLLC